MKKFAQAISAKCATSANAIKNIATNKRAASLWEYLLVIAVVCIVGAVVISLITGSNGLDAIWTGLVQKFNGVINTTP